MKKQTRIMSLRLTEELSDKLFTIAQDDKISVSELTRKLYEDYFDWKDESAVSSEIEVTY